MQSATKQIYVKLNNSSTNPKQMLQQSQTLSELERKFCRNTIISPSKSAGDRSYETKNYQQETCAVP